MDQLRALSVRQPWAHAIVHFGKDIENRSRRLGHRGWTLIHASGGLTPDENSDAADWMSARGLVRRPLPGFLQLDRGGIVGIARVVDSISAADERSASRWWMGPFGLVLRDARPLPFTPCKGTVAPLFWRPDQDTLDRLRPAILGLGLPELGA
jgi:hypothetical protein